MMFKRFRPDSPNESRLVINYNICHGCGACVAVCPPDALFLRDHLIVDQSTCTVCERCVKMCPVHALALETIAEPPPVEANKQTNGHHHDRHERRRTPQDGV